MPSSCYWLGGCIPILSPRLPCRLHTDHLSLRTRRPHLETFINNDNVFCFDVPLVSLFFFLLLVSLSLPQATWAHEAFSFFQRNNAFKPAYRGSSNYYTSCTLSLWLESSLSVKGLDSNDKRTFSHQKLKRQKANVMVLQEMHLDQAGTRAQGRHHFVMNHVGRGDVLISPLLCRSRKDGLPLLSRPAYSHVLTSFL